MLSSGLLALQSTSRSVVKDQQNLLLCLVTNKLSFEVRNSVQDEMETFEDAGKVQYQDLKEKLTEDENIFHVPTVSFISEGVLYCQANSLYAGAARFLVTINSDLSFEYHHYGVKVSITTLAKNKIFRLDRWSKVNEVIRYLNCLEVDLKHQVLLKHLDSLGSVKVGMKMYDPEVMVMAFEYAATSRSAYTRIKEDINLPSLKVLSRLTSKKLI